MFKAEFHHHSGNEKLILLRETFEEAMAARPNFPGFKMVKVGKVFWDNPTEFEREQLRGL